MVSSSTASTCACGQDPGLDRRKGFYSTDIGSLSNLPYGVVTKLAAICVPMPYVVGALNARQSPAAQTTSVDAAHPAEVRFEAGSGRAMFERDDILPRDDLVPVLAVATNRRGESSGEQEPQPENKTIHIEQYEPPRETNATRQAFVR